MENIRLTNWHVLAQQRSSSQDSQNSSNSDSNATTTGSDSNLTKRRNLDIRKSTLMKRFWRNSKGDLDPASVSHSYAVKNNSTQSLQDLSKSQQLRNTQSPADSCTTNISKSEEDSYVVYSSITDGYPLSTRSETSNNNPSPSPTNKKMTETKTYKINNNGISDITNETNIPTLPIKYQFVIDEDQNHHIVPNEQPRASDGGKTNLNVITNVQLSQSTLNTIFSQVMQDVLHSPSVQTEIIDDNITKQPAFNFKLDIDDTGLTANDNKTKHLSENDQDEYIQGTRQKYISEVNVGSPYKKCASPSVPRLSALPRTTSMEVNISSNDSLDRDSDTSYVDSLDDPSSPRLKIKQETNINITKEKTLTVVGDNGTFENEHDHEIIEKEETKKLIKKSSVFYIPIDDSLNSDVDAPQIVSNMLPSKLKEKLQQRQMKREEKRMQERMKAFDVENGNASAYFSTSPELPLAQKRAKKSPKRTITSLPQININKNHNKSLRSTYTHRSLSKYRQSAAAAEENRKSFMLPKTHGQTKIASLDKQQRTQAHISDKKHIEILEIMEIVDPERFTQLTPKSKSRIPVFQHTSSTKLPKLRAKPTFLDFGEVGQPGDPKLDQLIANILIDTLNHEDLKEHKGQARYKPNTISDQGSVASTSRQDNTSSNLIEETANLLTKHALDKNLDSEKLVENVDPQRLEAEDIPKGRKSRKTSTKSTQYDIYQPRSGNPRRKIKHQLQDKWEITLRSNYGDNKYAPEVEMKIKLPSLNSNKKLVSQDDFKFEDVCKGLSNSEIYKSKQYLRNSSNNLHHRRHFFISPRATKTSRQRTMLHRSRHSHNVGVRTDHPQSQQEVLTVSGSGVTQISRVSQENFMGELLLRRPGMETRRQQRADAFRERYNCKINN